MKERSKRKRPISRQTRYEKTKLAEAIQRSKQSNAPSTTPGKVASTKGKERAKEIVDNPHPFRYKSFNDRLASVRINVATDLGRSGTGALAGLDAYDLAARGEMSKTASTTPGVSDTMDLDDTALHARTPFATALAAWKELNLSLPFTSVAKQLTPITTSLPLMLHNQEKIALLLSDALEANAEDSYLAYEPVLDLIPRLASDVGSNFLVSYAQLIKSILRTSTINKLSCEGDEYTAAVIVERCFESLAATLRCMAPFLLYEKDIVNESPEDWLIITWHAIRPYLGWPDTGGSGNGELESFLRPKKGRKRISPHTKRFASEALAHLIRRAKSDQMLRLAQIMHQDASTLADRHDSLVMLLSSIADVWSEVVQSVEGKLHTKAPTYLNFIVREAPKALDDKSSGSTASLGIGVYLLASIVNHAAQPTELESVLTWLLDILDGEICQLASELHNGRAGAETFSLRQAVECLSVFVGLHKGRHVADSAKSKLFATMKRLSTVGIAMHSANLLDGKMAKAFVELLANSILAARLKDLMGPVTSIMNEQAKAATEDNLIPLSSLFAPLSVRLAEVGFHGVDQVVIPAILKATDSVFFNNKGSLSDECTEILVMLQSLQRAHLLRLQSATIGWRDKLGKIILERIEILTSYFASDNFQSIPCKIDGELACLGLAAVHYDQPHAAKVTERLCALICAVEVATRSTARQEEMRGAFNRTPVNVPAIAGQVLASLLGLLTNVSMPSLKTECMDVIKAAMRDGCMQRLAVRFAWHRSFMVNLGALTSILTEILPLEMSKELVEASSAALCSTDPELRAAAGKVLRSARQADAGAAVFAQIVHIEECGLDIDRIRERNVLLRSLGRSLARSDYGTRGDVPSLAIMIRYIASSMKLNLRPLWADSRAALSDISSQQGQQVWQVTFDELRDTFSDANAWENQPQEWTIAVDEREESTVKADAVGTADLYADNSIVTEIFKDMSWLSQKRELLTSRAEVSAAVRDMQAGQFTESRFDRNNYQEQLLSLLSDIHIITERNNAPIIDHFFNTIVRDDRNASPIIELDDDWDLDDEGGAGEATARTTEGQTRVEGEALNRKQRHARLCAYLELFGRFSNPRAAHRSEELRRYLYRLCSQGEVRIQRLALEAILRWKEPAHVAHATLLRALLQPSEFREHLTSLSLAPNDDGTVLPSHRTSLLPLLLRLFFGLIISRRSRAGGQANRRTSILGALAVLADEEMCIWTAIMLEPFKDISGDSDGKGHFSPSCVAPLASTKAQQGFLGLLDDVLKSLGTRLMGIWEPLLCVTLNITIAASRQLNEMEGATSKLTRSMRQDGLRLINLLFRKVSPPADKWTCYMSSIFKHLISPRLASLRDESVQQPSPILELAHTWSFDLSTMPFLVQYDERMIASILACVEAPGVKPAVTDLIVDLLDNIISSSLDQERNSQAVQEDVVLKRIFEPYLAIYLHTIGHLLQHVNDMTLADYRKLGGESTAHQLLDLLLRLSPHVRETKEINTLIHLLSRLLRRSHLNFHERGTLAILSVIDRLLPNWLEKSPDTSTLETLCVPLSTLFSRLKSRQGRQVLCSTFRSLAKADESLAIILPWLDDLNAYDSKRMDEYDFERRLSGFESVSGEGLFGESVVLNAKQWSPLLHNFLYYLQDTEELALRASAASALRRFVDNIAQAMQKEVAEMCELQSLLVKTVFPGLRRSMRSSSDLVKREAVEVFGHAVSTLPTMPFAVGLQGLLVEGDEEASFFTNIFHIQTHRRARAMNRLAVESRKGSLDSRTIVEVFLPIIESFLLVDVNHGDSNVVQNAVDCIGSLARQLPWGPYNVLLWRYLSYSKPKDKDEELKVTEKVSVRAAMSVLDNFHFALDSSMIEIERVDDTDGDADIVATSIAGERDVSSNLLDAVRNRLLPKLMSCLEVKDELEDSVRLPIAVGIARILLRFPDRYRTEDIRRLLNALGQILRSKAQDTRDLVRSTLSKVAIVLGPEYFSILLTELRKVLNRGPQLAVLAFTLHNVLIQCTEAEGDNRLKMVDDGSDIAVDIVIEDIFGRTAEDRQSIENRTTYREVRSSKSLDTVEQLARLISESRIRNLLLPLKNLMAQTESAQAVRLFEEYLRRVTIGLQANVHFSNRDFLILCNALLNSKSSLMSNARERSNQSGVRKTSALLAKRQDVEAGPQRDHFAHNKHRFTIFGLDLLTAALRKERFDFNDVDILAMLEPLTDLVGATLYANHAGLVIGGMRSLALLVRCPLQSIKTSSKTTLRQTLRIIERQGNAHSETMQAALKLLVSLLKEHREDGEQGSTKTLSEKQVSLLCGIIDTNLDESVDMQSTIFALLRTLISCKVAVVELYDLMDKVARLSIVHQSEIVRSMARSAFIAFLLDIPQGRKRFDNQMQFLVKNLDYVYESGRQSVLATISLILGKMANVAVKAHLELIFVGLIMRLANEESVKCRESTVSVLRQVLAVCDTTDLTSLVRLSRRWSQASYEDVNGRKLQCVTMMLFNIMIEGDEISGQKGLYWIEGAFAQARSILEYCADELEQQENLDEELFDVEASTGDLQGLAAWQPPYQALQFLTRAYRGRDMIWASTDEQQDFAFLWPLTSRLLLYPHSWIRLAASRLLGEHFNTIPYRGVSNGETLAEQVEMSKRFALILQSPNIDEVLSTQTVKNLVWLAKRFFQHDQNFRSFAHSSGGAEEDGAEDGFVDAAQDGQFWRTEPLRWLFNKLSHQLRRSSTERLYIASGAAIASHAILKWMAAMMSFLDANWASKYLIHIVVPIFRLLEGGPSEGDAGRGAILRADSAGAARRSAVESLAREVQDLVQAKVGTKRFAQCYADVKRKATGKRKERREREVQNHILHPENASAKKAQRSVRKHQDRKRKSEAFSMSKERVRSNKRQR